MTNVLSVLNSDTPVCLFGQTEPFRCHRRKQLGVTDFNAEKTLCHVHPAYLFQLHSMILVLYLHHILYAALLCDSRTKPILTHTPEDPFLEIDLKGGAREITSKLNHFKGGECLITSKSPRCLVFKRREVTCL